MSSIIGVRGGLSVDHLVDSGSGARFDELGGPALFGALGARLVAGTRVSVLATLPDDEPRFEQLFRRLGFDLAGVQRQAKASRLWILNSSEGRRIVSTAPAGEIELEGASLAAPSDEPRPVPVVGTLDGLLDSSPSQRPLVDPTVRVGIDPHQAPLRLEGIEYIRRVSPTDAIVLPSRVQLRLIDNDPIAAAREIRDRFGLDVVARLDKDGIAVIARSGEWQIHDPDVSVVETTGAGDSSAAAIVAAWSAGSDLPIAAAYGASVARLALSAWGHQGLLAEPLTEPFPSITITRKHQP